MTKFTFWTGPPAHAQQYKSMKWVSTTDPKTASVTIQAWKGRAKKPFSHYRFRTEGAAVSWIEEQMEIQDERESHDASMKEAKAAQTAEMKEKMTIGTILHYSWGWEQTNCDFFEVVGRTASSVTLRAIASETVSGGGAAMSRYCRPIPGQYVGQPFRKLIKWQGVKMDHGVASPCDPNKRYCESWYA